MSDITKKLIQAQNLIEQLQNELASNEQPQHENIAIVGMGCRFPGGLNTIDKYWNFLVEGKNAIREIPEYRFNAEQFYSKKYDDPGKATTKYGAYLDELSDFDPEPFAISLDEAASLDLQHKLLLQVTYEAILNAKIPLENLATDKTGIFIGMGSEKCEGLMIPEKAYRSLTAHSGVSNTLNGAAGRLSYWLNASGPCVAFDTACSAALVALHYACMSLRNGECDTAIVGAVNIIRSPLFHIIFSKMGKHGLLSPDGYSRGYDKGANGMGRGEGCGVVILQRESSAISNKNNILGRIKASAISHKGHSNGLAVPSETGEALVMQRALQMAGIMPESLSYIEGHGIGLPLADALEFSAIRNIYGNRKIALASAKSNFGHLEEAAGMAGLIKTALALKHKILPPHLHFKKFHPYIEDLGEHQIFIPTKPTPWFLEEVTHYAAINSFSWVGQNAHVILQE